MMTQCSSLPPSGTLSASRGDLASVDLAGGRPILEPVGRNTAAAVAIAALTTLRDFGDDLVLVVPSDHEIQTDAEFWSTIEAGAPAALNGHLVVFGLRPTGPETGYGYIEAEARGSRRRRSQCPCVSSRSRTS